MLGKIFTGVQMVSSAVFMVSVRLIVFLQVAGDLTP
jgi:hypothetical protein